jgi:lipoprotein-releasing system ATP-binding protein
MSSVHTRPSPSSRRLSQRAKPKSPALLEAQGIFKSYRKGPNVVPVLSGVDIQVQTGEFLSIVGQSGSGKSTLLHLLGTLDRPDEGQILFEQKRIDSLPNAGKENLRNRHIGMIFQFYHLLPELSTLENVLAPYMIGSGMFSYWRHRKEYIERAKHLLDMVGLSHRLTHKPCELSGGEMQRTAIARALISQPQLLLADEPTGNLDHRTGGEIVEILRTLNEQEKLTIVMVTHDEALASECDRIVRLVDGVVEQRAAA